MGVFLSIATDGLPTTPSSGTSTNHDRDAFIEILRKISTSLPVQLVIRLCTDDDSTVAFYNTIDEEMELPLDILDDIVGEAKEIEQAGNGWFTYTPLLHKIREAGSLCKLLDDLDEKSFSNLEIRQFCAMLTSSSSVGSGNDRTFLEEMVRQANAAKPVYNPISESLAPSVNEKALRRAMKVGFRGTILPILIPCVA